MVQFLSVYFQWLQKYKGSLKSILFLGLTGLLLMFFISQKQNYRGIISQAVREKFKAELQSIPLPDFKEQLGFEVTKELANLGRMLFNDPVLSRNNDVSCATCHLSNHGFADGNRLNFGALGSGGPTGKNVGKKWGSGQLSLNRFCSDDGFGFHCVDPMFRNSISTINVVYRANSHQDSGLLWDGRFGRLAFQVLLPIHTPEEMCGVNPVPVKDNPFRKEGPLFDQPVTVQHSHLYHPGTGEQIFQFNSPPQIIHSVESFRLNNNIVYPSRNECMAIMVSKLRKIPWYRKQFHKIFHSSITDVLVGKALAGFVSTHIANDSPYDRFVAGQNALSIQQLKGLAVFMTPVGDTVTISGRNLKGAGCVHCHTPPLFGGKGYYTLGIKGDKRSPLSRPGLIFNNSGFVGNIRTTHGTLPACHVANVSADPSSASPDIGRAIATSHQKNCFQFRTPVLRNVIETYPYFHHGTGVGFNYPKPLSKKTFKEISYHALKLAVQYHLRGPVDITQPGQFYIGKVFFDPFFQVDPLVPAILMDFGPNEKMKHYPVRLDSSTLSALIDFVAFGLFDKKAVRRGYLNNRLSHPKTVPSGFIAVTRDYGTQKELPPTYRP